MQAKLRQQVHQKYAQIKETFEPVVFYFELQGASE
jgi:hypothetical protein